MPFNDKCLYVKGLSVETNAEDLKRIFGKVSHVQSVKKISPQTAIVVFAKPFGAKQAIEILNGSQINGRTIVVEYKKDKKKNRSQSSQQAPHQTPGCTRLTSDRNAHESSSEDSEDDCDSNRSCRNTTDDGSISGQSTNSFVSSRRGRGGLNFSRRGNASERGLSGRRPLRGNIRGRVATGATRRYSGARDPSPAGSTASDGNAGGLLGENDGNRISNRRGRGWRRVNCRGRHRGGSRQSLSLVADVPDFESPSATAQHVDASDASETASESSEDEDTSSYFKETRKVERYKLRLLTARHKLDQLKIEMHIDIVSNLKESSITVEGPKSKVFRTFSVIEELLDNMICATDSVTDQFEICFCTFTAKEVVEKFKDKHIYAGWNCANGKLHVCGDRQRDATIAMDLIKSLVCEASYPIEGELSAKQQDYVANGGRFYTLKAKLIKEQANSCLQIQYHVPSQKIQFALKSSGDIHAVIQALDDFFGPCNVFEEYVDVEAETAKLLLANKDYVLLQCSQGATIDLDRLTGACNCHIQSTSLESLQRTKEKLLETINQKWDRAVPFEKPGDTAWLVSAMGKAKVDDINKLCRSVSSMRIGKLWRARSAGSPTTTYVPKPVPRKNVNSGSTSSDQTAQSRSQSPPRAAPRAAPPPSGIIDALVSIFLKKKTQPATPTTSSTNITSPKPPSASVVLPQITPTTAETLFKLEIVSNDICSVPAEGIVSSQGAIAKSIEGKGLPGLKLYLGIQNVQLTVGLWRKSVRIYHLQTDSWSGDHSKQKLEQNIKDAFQTLSQYQVTTMAFPAIGTGALNYPTDVVAVTMINTLLRCLEETPSVRKVTIAIHPSAPLIYQVFKDHYARHSTDVIVPLRVPMYTPSKRVTVTFTSLRLADAKEAEERLKKELSLHMTSVNWASSPHRSAIGDLSQQELDTIYERAVSCDVKVVFDLADDNIELDGQKDDVTKLREEIIQILHKKPPAPVGAASLPNHWDQSALVAGSYEVELSRTSEEFRTVCAKFHKTCEKRVTIFKIKRIQNEHLYTQYQAQKSKVLKDLGGDKSINVERELWHGTSAESTKLICANEFNRSFAGKNGVAYGIGTYFSVTSNYSISYSSDRGYKYLILAKVATGRYKRGDNTTERKNLPQGYHSTVDSTANPKIFVVYHDAAAYPEYVVKYTADQFL